MTLLWFKWLFANLGSAFVVNLAINALAPLIEKVVLHTVARTLISDIFIFLYRFLERWHNWGFNCWICNWNCTMASLED